MLMVLESRRNLTRLARERALTAKEFKGCLARLVQDQRTFELRDLTRDLCESSVLPTVARPAFRFVTSKSDRKTI